jgi:hypothetical protein
MAISKLLSGRAGSASVQIEIEGLYPALARWAKADPMFNKEIRAASVQLIGQVVTEVQSHASYAPNPRQAIESAKGFRARPDRVPVIRLSGSTNFVSQSRPNRRRKRKVTRGDVFFGSEFGSDRLRQFPNRSPKLGAGNRGYYFWPTIEAMSPKINAEYLRAIDRILSNLTRMG